ncbi:MAG: nucleotidyltransferase domain-containing protein [Gammaproteobacteria bacterium]|nr:nucleotidyltransferase domain-containing protein [Gammaproteobacteria bacterium]
MSPPAPKTVPPARRGVPPHGGIPPAVFAAINDRLDELERENRVRILLAVESGSRAWGFPSPDSDFDVRFVYAHDLGWYLSLDSRRDVIELPIEGDLDINGWDIKKALSLLIKPNPVLLEWLQSPIAYRADEGVKNQLMALANRTAHRRPLMHHYLHHGRAQFRDHIDGRDTVSLKRYFYVVRPALALRWIRQHPDRLVPMALPELLSGLDMPGHAVSAIEDLISRKTRSRELGEGKRSRVLDELVLTEFELAERSAPERTPIPLDLLDGANSLFRELVRAP